MPGWAARLGGHDVGADRDDPRIRREPARGRQLATEHAHLDHGAPVGPRDADRVAQHAPAGQGRERAREVAAVSACTDEIELAYVVAEDLRDPFGGDHRPCPIGRGRLGDGQDAWQVARELLRGGTRVGPDDDAAQLLATRCGDASRERGHFGRDLREAAVLAQLGDDVDPAHQMSRRSARNATT